MSYNVKIKSPLPLNGIQTNHTLNCCIMKILCFCWESNFPVTFDISKRAIDTTNHY